MRTRALIMVVATGWLLPWALLPASAQTGLPPGPGGAMQDRAAARSADAIKTVLDLTERQFNELNDLREAHNQKLRELSAQMRELDSRRRDAMKSGDNPALVGSLALQIQQLQQQMQEENKAYHENALRILDGSQREKVARIEEALKLAPSAGALMQYGLLDTSQLPGGGLKGVFMGGPGERMWSFGAGPQPAPPAGP